MNRLMRVLFGKSQPSLPTSGISQSMASVGFVFQNKGSGTFGSMQYREAVSEGYKSLSWVYRCIKKRGETLGSVPWKVYKRVPGAPDVHLPGHELETLLNRPNPFQDRKEFFEQLSTYLDLSGNNYIELVKIGGKPRQLWNMRPDWTKPIPNSVTYISGYELTPQGKGKPIPFKPEDVIHFKYFDPMNEYVGMSPITAAARTIESENAIVGWNKGMLENNATPGGVLKVPAQTLITEEREKLQSEIEIEFTGENRHRPMVLWGGMEWQQLGISQKDMDYLLQRRANKYEICAILGVPAQVVGANEDPTYSNYSVARLSFWEDCIILMLDWLAARFNMQLSPYWGSDIYVNYDISDVPAMRESFMQKVKTAEILAKLLLPINAINQRLGLGFDPVPWGDQAWIPASMVPAGGVLGNPGEDAPEGEEPDDETEEPDDQPEIDPAEEGDPTGGQDTLGRFQRRSNAVLSALEKLQ